jgi:hypothetical protein
MKKKFQICFPKCLKSAAKLRRANQTARAILTAPTVSPARCKYIITNGEAQQLLVKHLFKFN